MTEPHDAEPEPSVPATMADLKRFRDAMTRFMLSYRFGIDEIMTKIDILKTEFEHLHEYSPIEHVSSRLKTPQSILTKARRRGIPVTMTSIQENILDIAGVRVVCSFINDAYALADLLTAQRDLTVVQVKDYIKHPKSNGYKSLHLIVKVPVFLSSSVEDVHVELQIRTIAMDFWASLEHKIYYKFDQDVPADMLDELAAAAHTASELDERMQRIHHDVAALKPVAPPDDLRNVRLPAALDEFLGNGQDQH
ncbi:GTP pyrophosphokinase [Parenemella sanctibonifatiensis]|nr:GTP pyrophosphokinase family protein [Parenemella sanctibonifatiensis]